MSGNYNNFSSTNTYAFGAYMSGVAIVTAAPFVTNSKLNITYTKNGVTSPLAGYPITVYNYSDVNNKYYYFDSPISGSYTLNVTYTLPSGKSASKSYNINPTLTASSSTIKLYAYNSGSAYGFNFTSGLASLSKASPIDIYLSGTSTTFTGTFKSSSGNYEIVPVSLSYYNSSTTQGDLDYLFDGGYTYSSYTPTVNSAYVIRCVSRQNGHNYAIIKVTAISDAAGSAADYMTFDYKF